MHHKSGGRGGSYMALLNISKTGPSNDRDLSESRPSRMMLYRVTRLMPACSAIRLSASLRPFPRPFAGSYRRRLSSPTISDSLISGGSIALGAPVSECTILVELTNYG